MTVPTIRAQVTTISLQPGMPVMGNPAGEVHPNRFQVSLTPLVDSKNPGAGAMPLTMVFPDLTGLKVGDIYDISLIKATD